MKKYLGISFVVMLIAALACQGEFGHVNTSAPSATQLTGVGTPRPHCASWSLDKEMRVSPNQENPNRDACGNAQVWYFMQSSSLERDPETYQLLPDYKTDVLGVPGLELWEGTHVDGAPYPNQPSVGMNITGVTQRPLNILWLPKVIYGHPAPKRLLVVGWHSPYSGTIKVMGSVMDLDSGFGDGIAWFIDHGSIPVASGEYQDGGSQNFRDGTGGSALDEVDVKSGEFIYFILHPKSNHGADSTLLDIRITISN